MSQAAPSLKRFQRLVKVVQLGLGMLFAGFACTLGMKVVDDVDGLFRPVDARAIRAGLTDEHLEARVAALARERSSLDEKRQDVDAARHAAVERESQQRAAYQSFLQARAVTGSAADNAAIRSKLAQLEEERAQVAVWQGELDALEARMRVLEREKAQLQQARYDEDRRVNGAVTEAERARTVRVFLARLLVVAPVLMAAAWLWVKRRKTGMWPLVWGFLLFAL
jgi:hypothetical protein